MIVRDGSAQNEAAALLKFARRTGHSVESIRELIDVTQFQEWQLRQLMPAARDQFEIDRALDYRSKVLVEFERLVDKYENRGQNR